MIKMIQKYLDDKFDEVHGPNTKTENINNLKERVENLHDFYETNVKVTKAYKIAVFAGLSCLSYIGVRALFGANMNMNEPVANPKNLMEWIDCISIGASCLTPALGITYFIHKLGGMSCKKELENIK